MEYKKCKLLQNKLDSIVKSRFFTFFVVPESSEFNGFSMPDQGLHWT